VAPALEEIFQSFDAIVAPSCGMVAPLGVGSTGPSDFIKFWTAFGLPHANVPLPRATGELPLGLQLIGAFRNDAGLLRVLERIAELLCGLSQEPRSPSPDVNESAVFRQLPFADRLAIEDQLH
jgi:Asp-tRNA(Asn)/Glu-tRNA(Gln) amidotransferase A subunit family amidase